MNSNEVKQDVLNHSEKIFLSWLFYCFPLVPYICVGEFPHLAIAVSPRLEVKSSGHAWLDGCNFQRKRLLAPTGYRHRNPADENIDDAGNLQE